MGWGLKRNAGGYLERSSVDGHLCICLATGDYTVVFPNNDGQTYERTYQLTESGGIFVGSGSISVTSYSPLYDIAYPLPSGSPSGLSPWVFQIDISIEMTIDGGTGERSVRVISDWTVTQFFPNTVYGQSDYTEVFASGDTFNLSASSVTVRPVTLV